MFLDYIDFRIILASGLISMLVFIFFLMEIEEEKYRTDRRHEECDDSVNYDYPSKRYRWCKGGIDAEAKISMVDRTEDW